MNLTPVPLKASQILKNIDRWRSDAYTADLDLAELMRHFNGGALEVEDANGECRERRPNLLFGNKHITRPIQQLLAVYDDGLGMIDIQVKRAATPQRRIMLQRVLNLVVNEEVQRTQRLFWPFRSMCGDAVIWGRGCLWRDSVYDWVPKYGRPRFPWDAPTDITDDGFTDWAFPGTMTIGDIVSRLERIQSVADDDSHWNKKAMAAFATKIARRHQPDDAPFPSLNEDDPVSFRVQMEGRSDGRDTLSRVVPVYWYFCKRFDGQNASERPVDLYCVAGYGAIESVDASSETPGLKINRGNGETEVLFHQPRAFESILDCFWPFTLDVNIGGDPLMRRSRGLGVQIYDLDVRIQGGVNTMIEGAEFDFAPLFHASDTQAEIELQAISGTKLRPYDVIPTGARFAEKPRNGRPYGSMLEMTQLISGEMRDSAATAYGGGAAVGERKDELEVQVLERQNQRIMSVKALMTDFCRRGDNLCDAIVKTIFHRDLIEGDPAFSLQEKVRERLEEWGVSWEEIRGVPWHDLPAVQMSATMRRLPGHGDPGLALNRARQMMPVAAGIGPEAVRYAQRQMVSAIHGGDFRLAMELVPDTPAPQDVQQIQMAQGQSALALTTLIPPQPGPADNAMIHAPVHLQILQAQVEVTAQGGGRWQMKDQKGFEALAAHTVADVKTLSAVDPNSAKQMERAVQQLVGKAQQFEVGSPDQPDPVDLMKLQLAQRAQHVKEVKTIDDMQHRKEAQIHREDQAAFQQNLQLAHLSEAEKAGAVKRATSLASTAHAVSRPITEPATAE